MLIAKVQFAPWDKVYNFSLGGLDIKAGDSVIAKTELGLELGRVSEVAEISAADEAKRGLKPIVRLANESDSAHLPDAERKTEILEYCRTQIDRLSLPMKLIDVHFSFEDSRYNFAFIADGRVDFRELVKDLTGHFNASIRLTQIGTRDETKIAGDCGACGRSLCCKGCLKEFCSITSEMAEVQQVANRGSDRISGICGRLMCCLAFEYEGYKVLDKELPPIGTTINMDGVRGTIINHHILKQTVDVRVPAARSDERDAIIEVDVNRHKKKTGGK